MNFDTRRMRDLMEESQDLQVDAMRDMKQPLDEIVEAGRERRAGKEYQETRREFAARRKDYTRRGLFVSSTGLAAAGLLTTAAGRAFAAEEADVMALQTAASLENLAVMTYKTALTLDYLKKSDTATKTIAAFAEMMMKQHMEHGEAFNARAVELGGKKQTETNPKYTPVVTEAVPKLKKGDALDVVALAITLEDVATSTYVQAIQDVSDAKVRQLFGSVAGVESQHLATLYAVQALLKADAPKLITLKATGGAVDATELPAAAGSVGIPETFKKTDLASPPEEGAVK